MFVILSSSALDEVANQNGLFGPLLAGVTITGILIYIFSQIFGGALSHIGERIVKKIWPEKENTLPTQPVESTPIPQLPADRFPTHLPAAINQKVYRPRTDDRNKVTEMMAKGQQVVISGIGGIGKTTLARDLFFRQAEHYDYACWVNYNATLEDSLCAAFHLFEDAATQDEKLAHIVAFLRNDKTKLLVVDNADETIEKSLLLRELVARKQIHVVLTARTGDIAGFEACPLDFLSPEECKALFYGYCDSMSDGDEAETVAELIKEVSCHTLALELLAKAKPRGQTLKAFYERLKDEGFGFPDMNVRTTHQEQVAQTVAEHLHKLYRMESLPEEQQRILRNLAFMPTMPIPAQVNEWISCKENDLNDLIRLGWLTASGAYYFMHPIVKQTILLDKSEFPKDTGTEFVECLAECRFTDELEHYTTAIPKLELAEGFLTDWLSWSGAQTEQAADACNELDCCWSDLGDYHKALNWGKKGLAIKEKILPGTNSLATSYNNVGSAYGKLGNHNKELEYKLKALNICEEVLPANHPDLAASYNNVGYAYGELGDHSKELEYYQKALNIREKVLPAPPPDLAQSYNNVGSAYGNLGDHNKELEYYQKALNIRKAVLPANHPALASSYLNVGGALHQLDRSEEARTHLLKAEAIYRERPECKRKLKTVYGWLSAVETALGNDSAAAEYKAKEKAIDAELQS